MTERTPEQIEALRKAGMGITPDGRAVFGYDDSKPTSHSISKADALDPVKYEAARNAAAEAGEPLQMYDPNAAAPAQPSGDPANFKPVEPVRISRTDASNPDTYRSAKAKAEADGVALEIVPDGSPASK